MAIKDQNGKFNSSLLDYVQQGSIKVLQSFLGKDNSDLRDSDGRTLLHYAAESNNVSMTRHFINNNYDVDIRDNGGQSPLMLAVAKDSFNTTKLLVEAGADIYMVDNNDDSETPPSKLVINLRNPALNENHQLVKSILKRLQKEYYNDEERLLEYLRDFGCSLVQILRLRNANMTRLMLGNGYLVDERDLLTSGTALQEAVKLIDFDNVKVLLEFGASVDALDDDNYPPLYSLYHDYINWRLYTREEEEEKVKIMKILIDHGALCSQATDDPMTPVQYIFESGRLLAITTLMQYYVGFNSYDALHCLIENSNDAALEVVRGKNINVNYHNQDSLLSYAVYMGSFRKVQFLLEYGADPNAVDVDDGKTPLLCAFTDLYLHSEDNLVPIVRLLLQYGADAQFAYTEEQKTLIDLGNRCGEALESVIAHLAMIETCGVTISELIRQKIDSRVTYKQHFRVCKKQIKRMKKKTVNGSVTLYKLLTDSHVVITRYARDPEFTPKFEEAMKVKSYWDPYYLNSLRRRVGKAVHVAKLKEEAVVVMNKIFGYRINNYHEILSEIVDYFNSDDLKNVCRIYNLQESEPFQLDKFFV